MTGNCRRQALLPTLPHRACPLEGVACRTGAVETMDIRQLQYLAALAREKHFTRAAKVCNVTQPTLSGRIRQLEQELGVPIVERGQRFHGLTPEGEKVLKWALAILDNWS